MAQFRKNFEADFRAQVAPLTSPVIKKLYVKVGGHLATAVHSVHLPIVLALDAHVRYYRPVDNLWIVAPSLCDIYGAHCTIGHSVRGQCRYLWITQLRTFKSVNKMWISLVNTPCIQKI